VITAIAFYLLAAVSVMFLILTFFSAAGLFILMGAEFLALLLIMVYVGAVAVLFLFVVMMLEVDFVALKQGFLKYVGFGLTVAVVLLTELILVGAAYFSGSPKTANVPDAETSNLEAFGEVLYTDYAFFFEASGFILLVAMIGAIVLTLREREGVRKQDISKQIARTREDAIDMVDLKSGEGIGS